MAKYLRYGYRYTISISFEINPLSTELPDHDSVEVYVQNW